MNPSQQWGLRSVLGPVLTRLIIYGTHPVDVEHAMQFVENAPMKNALDLERNWSTVWSERAEKYVSLLEKASSKTMQERMYKLATQCYYATFLINYSEHTQKVSLYKKYAENYRNGVSFSRSVTREELLLSSGKSIATYIHTPNKSDGPFPTVVILAGLGSCKEEMEIFVEPLIQRGIAAVVPDLPGCGESIYIEDIKCRMETIHETFDLLENLIKGSPQLDDRRCGTAGLCMGGGLSYKAAARSTMYSFCATLFPLLINEVPDEKVPGWMKSGKWFELISGMDDAKAFINEMGLSESEIVNDNFLMIHSKHDNWMTLDMAKKSLFNKVPGNKELVVVDEEPVLTSKEAITHAMPVGEQMHWVKEVLADWIIAQTEAK